MVDLSFRIGGVAGAGVSVTALLLARVFKEHGYNIQTFRDIPSRIRGGHTSETVRISDKPRFSPPSKIDFLVAFDKETINRYIGLLSDKALVLVDSSVVKSYEKVDGVRFIDIPATKIAKEGLGNELFQNTVMVGFVSEMLGLDREIIRGVLTRLYGRKGEEILSQNFKALELGAKYFSENYSGIVVPRIEKIERREKMLLLTGNDAIALGALVAGCRFYSGYPITPATQILERLINWMPKLGGVAVQTEDEIAAVNAAIGASIAGVRSMTGTSGPGFSLMSEAVSLAGMAEVPLVLVNSNRSGPSTGMPTKTEQSDLMFTIYQGHGEFPKAVITPANAEEAFYLTVEAFNLADLCQCPVVIFVDEFISHGYQTASIFDLDSLELVEGRVAEGDGGSMFPRYKITEDGVSPRVFPGKTPAPFLVTGLEHDEYGFPVEEEGARVRMMDKRMRKIELIKDFLSKRVGYEFLGDEDSKLGAIIFGSVTGPVKEALDILDEEGVRMRVLRLKYVWPFPEEIVQSFVDSMDRVFVIEMNATGQLYNLTRMAGAPKEKLVSIRKYDGRLFTPAQVAEKIKEVL